MIQERGEGGGGGGRKKKGGKVRRGRRRRRKRRRRSGGGGGGGGGGRRHSYLEVDPIKGHGISGLLHRPKLKEKANSTDCSHWATHQDTLCSHSNHQYCVTY